MGCIHHYRQKSGVHSWSIGGLSVLIVVQQRSIIPFLIGVFHMDNRLFAVRGATQVQSDDKILIAEAVQELYVRIRELNHLSAESIVSLQFTVTSDLHALNPATALRSFGEVSHIPLFCMQEPDIEGMMERTIRCLIHYYAPQDHFPTPAYLRGTSVLRPDITR